MHPGPSISPQPRVKYSSPQPQAPCQVSPHQKLHPFFLKLPLFADDMMLHIENPKTATRKPLKLIDEFGKVAGYKINIWKSVAFLYIDNKIPEWEIRETIPFAILPKRIKYLGINPPQEAKHLYSKNYKTLMKKAEDHTHGKMYCVLGLQEWALSVTMLHKAIYRLSAIPIISPAALVTELEPKIKAALGSWKSEGGQGSTRQRRAGMDRKCQVKGAEHERFRNEWVETEGDMLLGCSQGRDEVLLMESQSHKTRKAKAKGTGRCITEWSRHRHSSKLCSAALAGGPDKGHLPISISGSAAVRQEGKPALGGQQRQRAAWEGLAGWLQAPQGPVRSRRLSRAVVHPRETGELPVSSLCDYKGTRCDWEERDTQLQCFESDCHSIKCKYIFNQMTVF